MQTGFDPGMSIHTAIDMLLVAQQIHQDGDAGAKAVCFLLDFAKAYNSLDCCFLLAVVELCGFHDVFTNAVAALHRGATGVFLVNGIASSRTFSTCGILLCSPLTMLLFILALNVLFYMIDQSPARGVRLPAENGEVHLRICDYADDTSLYLGDKADAKTYRGILGRFSAVAGLKVNA
ncbi:hypothetical protein PybrP1_008311 [[Pythium] brassicae (nom. inval.)]|nr:hypothetical protein PybrP1_008311 [[Pythium] brassicae (nom. inval.)]